MVIFHSLKNINKCIRAICTCRTKA